MDLARLAASVRARGGFDAVDSRDEWDAVAASLCILPLHGTYGSIVRRIYVSILKSFEELSADSRAALRVAVAEECRAQYQQERARKAQERASSSESESDDDDTGACDVLSAGRAGTNGGPSSPILEPVRVAAVSVIAPVERCSVDL